MDRADGKFAVRPGWLTAFGPVLGLVTVVLVLCGTE